TSQNGTEGSVLNASFTWDSMTEACSVTHRLLCFEQAVLLGGVIRQSPVATGPARRAFVSSLTFNGDLKTSGAGATGVAGADALCNQIATARSLGGTWKA